MKKVLFDNFQVFFIVFDHVNTCASIRSLVEKYNIQYFQGFANISYCYLMSIFRKKHIGNYTTAKSSNKGENLFTNAEWKPQGNKGYWVCLVLSHFITWKGKNSFNAQGTLPYSMVRPNLVSVAVYSHPHLFDLLLSFNFKDITFNLHIASLSTA